MNEDERMECAAAVDGAFLNHIYVLCIRQCGVGESIGWPAHRASPGKYHPMFIYNRCHIRFMWLVASIRMAGGRRITHTANMSVPFVRTQAHMHIFSVCVGMVVPSGTHRHRYMPTVEKLN